MDRRELRPSEDAPPKIHNNRELKEFIDPGFPPASGCWRSGCPPSWRGFSNLSGCPLSAGPSTPANSIAPFTGLVGLSSALATGCEGSKSVLTVAWFLVFSRVICNVDARMVEEVI